MAQRKKGKRKSRLRRQVDLEANVRYGPQKRALRELLDEAYETLKTTAATGEGAAQGVRAAVNAAKPQVKKIYADAHGSQATAESDVRRDLSMLSSAADPYKAVSAREAGGAKRRLAESLAGASKELVDRGVQAEQGRAYAVTNALRTYNTDRVKIRRERLGLADDIGDFKSLTYGNLKKARADERAAVRKENRDYGLRVDALGLTERNTVATERNAATGERAEDRQERAAKKPKKGPSGLTPAKKLEYRDKLRHIVATVQANSKDAKGKPHTYGWFYKNALAKGYPPLIAKAGILRGMRGGVDPALARRLKRQYGIGIKVGKPRKARKPGAGLW